MKALERLEQDCAGITAFNDEGKELGVHIREVSAPFSPSTSSWLS